MYLIKIISKYKLFTLFALYLQIVKRLNFHKYITFVSDSMALPVTSGHVNNTPCESCDFLFVALSFELLYVKLVVRVLILNRCET